ncbi:hypothetical protein MKW92_046680 [Papaver armeniacum]|nr:hypothetical protein MKW92_046680 [Papaver armeniacum]
MGKTNNKRKKLVDDDESHNKNLNGCADKKEPSSVEEAPYVIVVHGPPKVGKSLLIKSLIKQYTDQNLDKIQGPITVLTGNRRRIQFVECPNNMNGMIDAAKYADAVILLIDANYGFEMETFEFLNLLQVHGMPEVMGVLTYLDELEDAETRKERIMENFRANIHEGANIFCLSFLHGMYQKDEIYELANFLSVMEFHTSSRRAAHPYFLVDHFEDVTSPANVDMDIKCKRDIILYGYLRGCDIKKGTKVHIAGVGDYPLADITLSAEPIPLQPVDGNDKQINIEEPHLEIECFRRGTYLRFGVLGVPFEMVSNHNPCQPILVGGISRAEDNVGHMQVRLMQHSWHMNMLSTKDPIIVSVGWRRYQTTPIYYQVSYRRHKMLEFTPVGEPCLATFWGPLAPPGARVVAVRSLADNKAPFRILATADVLKFNRTAKIVERIKRIGTPCLILNETALIKDMFTSDDEVHRFRDVKIKTAHGIRGKVNEAAAKSELPIRERWNDGQPRQGIAKCTFDCRICMSDTIHLCEWTQVEVPRIFNPLTTPLEPSNVVWQDSVDKRQKKLNESAESKEHVLVIEEKNIARENVRKRFIDIYGEKLKEGPAQKRQTVEQRRAVIIVHPKPSGWDSEWRAHWVKQQLELIKKNNGPGFLTTECGEPCRARVET